MFILYVKERRTGKTILKKIALPEMTCMSFSFIGFISSMSFKFFINFIRLLSAIAAVLRPAWNLILISV